MAAASAEAWLTAARGVVARMQALPRTPETLPALRELDFEMGELAYGAICAAGGDESIQESVQQMHREVRQFLESWLSQQCALDLRETELNKPETIDALCAGILGSIEQQQSGAGSRRLAQHLRKIRAQTQAEVDKFERFWLEGRRGVSEAALDAEAPHRIIPICGTVRQSLTALQRVIDALTAAERYGDLPLARCCRDQVLALQSQVGAYAEQYFWEYPPLTAEPEQHAPNVQLLQERLAATEGIQW